MHASMHHSHEDQEKMGNLHSKSHGEESDQTPLLRLHYSERLPEKRSTFHSFIYETVIGLVQKLRFVFSLLSPRSKPANPILPVQNPAPIITTSNGSSDFSTDDQESHCEKIIIVESSQQWPAPENNPATAAENEISADHVQNHVVPFVLLEDESTELMTSSSQGKGGEKEEEVVIVKKTVAAVEDEGRWIKHYSSRHEILVVGDGDFSFSASLAVAFGRASNMIATSLDSKNFLKKNYWNAKSNIEELRSRGCKVIHGVDTTEMANHHSLGHLNFDRIVYNFPYAGFFDHLSRKSLLRRHRRLVSLFLKNAKQMISEDGEIHISHKTNGFHEEWKLVSIASSHGLRLIEAVDFDLADYPGYNTKYGFGGDDNFNCYPSSTYKFGFKILN